MFLSIRLFFVFASFFVALWVHAFPGLTESQGTYVLETKDGGRIAASFGPAFSDALRVMQSGASAGMHGPLVVYPYDGGIEGISPVYGTIRMAPKILFQWEGEMVQGVQPSLVLYEIGSLQHIPFSIRPIDKEIAIPAKHLGVKPGGEYRWYLGSLHGNELVGQSRVFSFRLLMAHEEKELHRDLKHLKRLKVASKEGEDLLKAQIYYKYRLYHDMVATLRPLHAHYPEEERIAQLLFLGYVKIGKRQAAKELQQRLVHWDTDFEGDQQALSE